MATPNVLQVHWSGPAVRDMRALERSIAQRVRDGVERFASTGVGDVKALQGEPGVMRLRVGDYRVRFEVEAHVLTVLRVAHRREVYR